MKTLKRTAFLLIAVAISNVSIGIAHEADSTEASVSVKQIKSEQKKALIRITNLSADKSAVFNIKDKLGYSLHRETIGQHEVHVKKYDFSNLPDGEYIVELKTGNGVITESFLLEAGKANPMYFKPAIQVEPGLIKVAFMNRIDTPVSLKLYDARGEVLYEEKVSSQQTYTKGLDVSKLKAGQYSLSVLGHNYVYSKNIQIK